MISYEEALKLVSDSVKTLGFERVSLEQAHTRVLSSTINSSIELPLFDNSAVDGFAVHTDDVPGELAFVGTIPAGKIADFSLERGTTVKVMTGAPVPRGTEAVVMREDVQDDSVFSSNVKLGDNIRRKGEEIRVGDILFEEGTVCSPPVISLLASAGVSEVDVYVLPIVGVLVTGDELTLPGETLLPGHIFESNGIGLKTALAEQGINAVVTRTSDDLDSTTKAVRELAKSCDVIITTGGVSVGDFDVVREAISNIGAREIFWRVAMKPGKPICFSTVDSAENRQVKYIFGLPGNPVSVLVTYSLFVVPALQAMQGLVKSTNLGSGTLEHDWSHRTGRLEFARSLATRNGSDLDVSLDKCQASHMLSGLANANSLAILDGDKERFDQGESIRLHELPWSTQR